MTDSQRTREGHEPEEAPRGLPLLYVLFVLAVGLWGAFYFYTETGDEPLALGDRRTLAALAPVEAAAVEGGAVDGAAVFASRCVACHQASGMGLPGAFPPLGGSEWVVGEPKRLTAIVLRGLQGEVTVAGQSYNGVMPAFAGQLNDEELAAVLTHIRSQFGNQASAVDPAMVASVREAHGGSASFQGQAELEAVTP